MPLSNVRMWKDEVMDLVAVPRSSAAALAVFGALALMMAAVGVYGVIAYSAEARTREIGVRMALGASRGQVLQMVLRDGVRVIASGLVLGTTASLLLTRSLVGLLHEVQPADASAFASVAALLGASGLLAIYLPARRATKVNAVEALRSE